MTEDLRKVKLDSLTEECLKLYPDETKAKERVCNWLVQLSLGFTVQFPLRPVLMLPLFPHYKQENTTLKLNLACCPLRILSILLVIGFLQPPPLLSSFVTAVEYERKITLC